MWIRVLVVMVLTLLQVGQAPIGPVLVFAQDPEPPPGTPHNPRPCNRPLEPVGHQCLCERKCQHDENGKVIGTIEDTKCRAYCRKDLCSCPVMDCTDEPREP